MLHIIIDSIRLTFKFHIYILCLICCFYQYLLIHIILEYIMFFYIKKLIQKFLFLIIYFYSFFIDFF